MLEVIYFLVLALFIYYLSQWIKYRGKNLPPGPLGLPFVGYLPFLDPVNPHLSLTKLAEKYGSIYSVQFGKVYTVVLSDVKLIRAAFAQECFSGRAPLFLTHGIMKGNENDSNPNNDWIKTIIRFCPTCSDTIQFVRLLLINEIGYS